MATIISTGFSQHPDPQKAILEACVQVKNQPTSSIIDLIIIFACPDYVIPEIQSVITRTLKPKHLIGTSTEGILLSNGVADHGIALVAISSDEMSFGISAVSGIENTPSHYTGFDLARKASQVLGIARRDVFSNISRRNIFIVFSKGIEKDSSQFIHGVKDELGTNFPVIGSIACGDAPNVKNFQFFHDQILQNSAVGLLLGGTFQLALGCKHSFKPLGKPRTVTKVDGSIIHTIDDKPAIELYRHFLGEDAKDLKNGLLNSYAVMYPLGFYMEESNQYLLRNIIDILEDGSIVCHEGVPQKAEVHLMISNSDSCVNSAIDAAKLAKTSLAESQAKLILVFESIARHKILGNSLIKEIEGIKDVLGKTTPIIGMCCSGEMGPFGTLNNSKNIYLHNESILIMAIA